MLIYVAVLTKFVISVVRISLAASSVSFSFFIALSSLFSFNICRYRHRFHNSVLYALYYLTCFRIIITFLIRGNSFRMLLLTWRLYCWNHCFAR